MNPMGETAGTSRRQGTRVSVLVPVYNAMPYLVALLDSLAEQDLADEAFEVLLVDDGSTDGGEAVLDTYCANGTNFRVVHQANSGWPGAPRNCALAMSSADYVFFADADDVLSASALRSMVEFADRHGSDVVIPQMAGLGGRPVSPTLFRRTQVDVDLATAFESLQPLKLYRRSLLADNGIRFPEGKVRLEDGIFNARAYLAAKRISVLTGESYYLLRSRDDGQNISAQRTDPAAYTASLAQICRIVRAGVPDPAMQDRIVLGLYQRKCLRVYRPGRFARYGRRRQDAWLEAHQAFIAEFIPADLEGSLPRRYRTRSRLVRAGDAAGLAELSRREGALQSLAPVRFLRRLWPRLGTPQA